MRLDEQESCLQANRPSYSTFNANIYGVAKKTNADENYNFSEVTIHRPIYCEVSTVICNVPCIIVTYIIKLNSTQRLFDCKTD